MAQTALDSCLTLLKGKGDESVFAGLLLLTKHVSAEEFLQNRRKIFQTMHGKSFLSRMLLSRNDGNQEVYKALGLGIMSFFCRDPELARDEFVDLVPHWVQLLKDLSADCPHSDRQDVVLRDLLQCFNGLVVGLRMDGTRTDQLEKLVDYELVDKLVQLGTCVDVSSTATLKEPTSRAADENLGTQRPSGLASVVLCEPTYQYRLREIQQLCFSTILEIVHQHPSYCFSNMSPATAQRVGAHLLLRDAMSNPSLVHVVKGYVQHHGSVIDCDDDCAIEEIARRVPGCPSDSIKILAFCTAQVLLSRNASNRQRVLAFNVALILSQHCGPGWPLLGCLSSAMRGTSTLDSTKDTAVEHKERFVVVLLKLLSVEITVQLTELRYVVFHGTLEAADQRATHGIGPDGTARFTTATDVLPVCCSLLGFLMEFLLDDSQVCNLVTDTTLRWGVLSDQAIQHAMKALSESAGSIVDLLEVVQQAAPQQPNDANQSRPLEYANMDAPTRKRFDEQVLGSCTSFLLSWMKEDTEFRLGSPRERASDVLPFVLGHVLRPVLEARDPETSLALQDAIDVVSMEMSRQGSSLPGEIATSAAVTEALVCGFGETLKRTLDLIIPNQQGTSRAPVDKVIGYGLLCRDLGQVLVDLMLMAHWRPAASIRDVDGFTQMVRRYTREMESLDEETATVDGLDDSVSFGGVWGVCMHILGIGVVVALDTRRAAAVSSAKEFLKIARRVCKWKKTAYGEYDVVAYTICEMLEGSLLLQGV